MTVRLRALSLVLALGLSGCVGGQSSAHPDSVPTTAPATAVVTATDITPVLTLPGTVRSAVVFAATAALAGTVGVTSDGSLVIIDNNGVSHPVAPAGAHTVELLVQEGDSVVAGLPLARMNYPGFVLVAEVAGADLLRFVQDPVGAKAQVTGSGGPFTCDLLDPVPSSSDQEEPGFIACRVPDDQQVIEGLTGVVAVRFPGKSGVPALPVEAVAGTVSSASVFVVDGDGVREVVVRVGVTDGLNIEIVSGIDLGRVVRIPSPTLLGH